MRVLENVSLASLTTFRVGGLARVVVECKSQEDIKAALMLAHERGLPRYVIGGGSNLVAPDEGYDGVIVLIKIPGLVFDDADEKGTVVVTVGAGIVWDEFVRQCTERGLWGVENLAGIPGTVGAAPVQNIGAYGAELADTLLSVEVLDVSGGAPKVRRLSPDECHFDYRESIFKHDHSLIITRLAFKLTTRGVPLTSYADLARRGAEGAALDTPDAIATVVREIRAQKFPDLRTSGTAGSFFKNPIITNTAYEVLKEKYPDLPGFPTGAGMTKVSLAWILDHVLNLRGFSANHVRLFERQPLVLVSESGATARDIDTLARKIESKVFSATNTTLEREVRMMH